MSDQVRLHARITGRVQGVGFRAFTQGCAAKLDLAGWVRNRWDGSVEVMAEGPQVKLEILLQDLRRGPFPGTTSRVQHDWLSATGEFYTFRVRMSG